MSVDAGRRECHTDDATRQVPPAHTPLSHDTLVAAGEQAGFSVEFLGSDEYLELSADPTVAPAANPGAQTAGGVKKPGVAPPAAEKPGGPKKGKGPGKNK